MTDHIRAMDASRGLRRGLNVAVTALLALYAVGALVQMALHSDVYQINFRVYYYSAKAYNLGLNPYDSDATFALANNTYVLPYPYPPLALHVFRPFAYADYRTAYQLYFMLKCAALAGLLWLWHAKFLRAGIDNFFLLFCVFGFNFCIWWDLQAGNVNLFEQALLWLGFYCFCRGNFAAFAVCVVIGSAFKLSPIVLLALPLATQERGRWLWPILGGAAFAALLGLSLLLYPNLFREYLVNINEIQGMVSVGGEGADTNFEGAPSTWAMVHAVAAKLAHKTGISIPAAVPVACFAAFAAMVVGLSAYGLRRAAFDTPQRRVWIVMIGCLVYMLLTPRLMVYSYVLAVLPAYYVVRAVGVVHAPLALLALSTVSTIEGRPPGFRFLAETLPHYVPVLLVLAVWALGIAHLATKPASASDRVSVSASGTV